MCRTISWAVILLAGVFSGCLATAQSQEIVGTQNPVKCNFYTFEDIKQTTYNVLISEL